jgi:23S rRNA (cytidine1920-2'-O)/16S rRNA (cytidine1409-2'-O)-methyltransferase
MKKRLDDLLIDRRLAGSKEESFVMVTEGRVFVQGQKAVSGSQIVDVDASLEVRSPARFVGRGAYKLESALDQFGIEVDGKACMDIGAATGGFTQVVLDRGARRVYAIDTARGKLATKLRYDPRVVVMEGMDVRDVDVSCGGFQRDGLEKGASKNSSVSPATASGQEFLVAAFSRSASGVDQPSLYHLPERVNLVTIDVSLIGLRNILPHAGRFLIDNGEVVALFKPQYETRDQTRLRRGVVKDERYRRELLKNFLGWAEGEGWEVKGTMESPIKGMKGNVEYLLYLKNVQCSINDANLNPQCRARKVF